MAKYVKGSKTGMIMKVEGKEGSEKISKAKPKDIASMNPSEKVAFSTAVKEQSFREPSIKSHQIKRNK